MREFTWSDAFEVGDAELDAQHRDILAGLARLVAALEGGDADVALERCRTLRHALEAHAGFEEALLEEAGFARTAQHAETHRRIAANWAELLGRCGERCASHREAGCIGRITEEIVRNEIIADLDYKAFLQERPRRPQGG
jgi:hemerythrin-like metal-binding protein